MWYTERNLLIYLSNDDEDDENMDTWKMILDYDGLQGSTWTITDIITANYTDFWLVHTGAYS